MEPVIEKAQVGRHELTVETAKMARQASGAVVLRCADTVVLVTVVCEKKMREGISFFPLTVEYRESAFAAGRIPGGFFKREGRPAEREILTCRLIDRPIRPLFPDGFAYETQIFAQPLSADPACDPDILALTGASTALSISDIPWNGPIAGARIVRLGGEFIVNPTMEEARSAELNIVLAASRDAIVMVEGEASEVPESAMIDALLFGHESIQPLLDLQERLVQQVGKPKREFVPPDFDPEILDEVEKKFSSRIKKVYSIKTKQPRYAEMDLLKEEVQQYFLERFDNDEDLLKEKGPDIAHALDQIKRNYVRGQIIRKGKRIDGRGLTDVRPISIDLGILPRVHGSALFTRGETQALVTTTLGSSGDEQKIEMLGDSHYRKFMLHYNFPAYSVGEVRPIRGPGRREIGHGNLAWRSMEPVIPDPESFPYTIRVVSDILESNGSSSMASVCGASLSMMQAGVPLLRPVAGVAMGLIEEGDDIAILTDILGDEDHLGDMDFKVTGTKDGICALQMDIKISGLSRELLQDALEQARKARLHILKIMHQAIPLPSQELSRFAPRILSIWIKPERIKDIIGPGGKMIKSIVEQTGVNIDIDDSGRVNIFSPTEEASDKAIAIVESLTREPEVGEVYIGIVKSIKEFGAFVEILPGCEGLLHISNLHTDRVDRVTDILQEGDEVMVKVLEIDRQGKIRLSRKDALETPPEAIHA